MIDPVSAIDLVGAGVLVSSCAWTAVLIKQSHDRHRERRELNGQNFDLNIKLSQAESRLAAEKAESENLCGMNRALRIKVGRLEADVAALQRRLAPFIAKRPRDEHGRYLKAVA